MLWISGVAKLNLLDMFKENEYSSLSGNVKYRIFVPEQFDKTKGNKMILWLHGAESQGSDNTQQICNYENFLKKILNNQTRSNFVVVAPQCSKNEKWVNSRFDKNPESYDSTIIPETLEMKLLIEAVNSIKKDYGIDDHNVLGIGFSLGAFALWDMAVRHPGFINRMVVISGGCDYRKAKNVGKMDKIIAYHSTNDPYINIRGVKLMCEALKKINKKNMELNIFDSDEHYIFDKINVDDLMQNFIDDEAIFDSQWQTY